MTREKAANELKHSRAVAGFNLKGEIDSILSIMEAGPAKEALQRAADAYTAEIKAARDRHEQETGVRYAHQ